MSRLYIGYCKPFFDFLFYVFDTGLASFNCLSMGGFYDVFML